MNKSKYQLRKEKKLIQELELKNKKKNELILEIQKYESFSVSEQELIIEINEYVMSVDGTAEGWGGYSFDPADYIGTSVEIFLLAKQFFKNACYNKMCWR